MKLLMCALGLAISGTVAVHAQPVEPQRVVVRGVELHYIERGQGVPLILLHGGQGDYRAWAPHLEALAPHFRVISYSRRYHHPNRNALASDHSVFVDAEDLAALVTELHLGSVHLVGTSYGALTALALSLAHPTMVRSLVLAEAPILGWALHDSTAAGLYREFLAQTHERAAPAFAAGDEEGAVRAFIDAFDGPGTFAALPPERRSSIMQNVGYFKAITAASNPYPDLSKSAVARVEVPALVVRGAQTHALDIYVADELARVLPRAQTAVIPNAGHGAPRTQPRAFLTVVFAFLGLGALPK